MTPQELKELAIGYYGERGWQQLLADDLKVSRRTVFRWMKMDILPPQWESHVRQLKVKKRVQQRLNKALEKQV